MIDIWQSPQKYPVYAIGLDKKQRVKLTDNVVSNEELKRMQKLNACRSYLEFEQLVQNNFNPSTSLFITLTFQDNDQFDVNSVDDCNKRFTRFIDKQLRKEYGKSFKYIATIEFQDKHGRGAVHYHMLVDMQRKNPYIDQEKLTKLWSYGSNVKVKKVESTKHAAVYVGKYMRKGLIDSRLIGKKKYWSSRGLIHPIEQYGTNVEQLLEFLSTVPSDKIEKYSESSYLSEYHGCEIQHSRLFISAELIQKFYSSIRGLQTS